MSSFTQFDQYEGFATIGMVHDKLKSEGSTVPIPTIRNWINELHELQVHTLPRNSRRERIFGPNDLELIRFIIQAKKRFNNNMNMSAIAQMLQDDERLSSYLHYDPQDGGDDFSGVPSLPEHRIKELLRVELEEISRLKVEMIESKNRYDEKFALMPSQEELERIKNQEREERITEIRTAILNERTTERRIRQILRVEAEREWNKNPIKKGLIFKSEDNSAKLLFIEKYITDRLEEAMSRDLE